MNLVSGRHATKWRLTIIRLGKPEFRILVSLRKLSAMRGIIILFIALQCAVCQCTYLHINAHFVTIRGRQNEWPTIGIPYYRASLREDECVAPDDLQLDRARSQDTQDRPST